MKRQVLKLLVIEDDPQDFILLKECLNKSQRSFYEITHTQHFDEALDLLLSQQYDLVLLDYFLGGHTGIDLLKHTKKVGLDTPVIVLTGHSNIELDDALMRQGAADFIPKDEMSAGLLERGIRHAVERKQVERQIAEMLKRDPLTGLGNRILFEEHIKLAIAKAERNKSQFAVIFIDLDRFNGVNNTLGHHIGDLLLTLIGYRLLNVVDNNDVVARIGGDEFTLLLENVQDDDSVIIAVEKVLSEVMQPAMLGTVTLDVSASVGVAMYPKHGTDGTTLMQKADMALYECKKKTFERCAFYTDELQQKLKRAITLEKEIRLGLQNNEFELYYQPKLDLRTGKLVGAEALIRWPQADGSMRMPNEFIPAANKMGLIVPLGEWVIDRVCQQLHFWLGHEACPVIAFNVSPKQLKSPGFKSSLLEAVKRYNIPPDRLEIELTEDAFIDTSAVNMSLLEDIRQEGIRISIDDFGTGYSSMRYLKAMPINSIKIDRGFVSGGHGEHLSDPTITQAIIFLSKGLSLEVIAEGIETQEQWDELVDYGCTIGQGFFLHRPMPAQDLSRLFF
ncbi:Phytochrome-like protein cph2 [Marinomonas spartinae]|uniref:Phytochrome-like protein cph2 n=1 Tax=Marinomonas spartinae TaxID=1792290 RepID=A0A1A8SZN9_9GAMM|nr:GGDEF domain-containing response regulator [Marinomonas spartinae]SBS24676.1 Phytochrome-like protein cph2 [Marinomonas spartinae]